MNFRVAQKVFIENEKDEVLVLRISKIARNPKRMWGKWDFPGGGVEIDEDLNSGLAREVHEEIGSVRIEVGKPVVVWDFDLNDPGREKMRTVVIGYRAKWLDGEIKLNEEHDVYRWVSSDEILKLDWHKAEQNAVKQWIERRSEV